MKNGAKRWELLNESKVSNIESVINILLKNRGIKTKKEKKEFFEPTDPSKISLKSLGIKESEVKKGINRIKKAKKNGELVIVYGDYDADGITGTATMWETLHTLGLEVLPHIPDRFSEGYGLNIESIKAIKEKYPKLGLIVTVDHGITVGKKVQELKKLGIDLIITDHHQVGREKPRPLALIYTTEIGGSALSWIFAREIVKKLKLKFNIEERLQLAAIGTIADQLPLLGPNRSIVRYGLAELNKTKRPGLTELYKESGLMKDTGLAEIGTYEVGFVIAPRINSMGRLKHGLESLRLLCTKDPAKAKEIAKGIGSTNTERQKIVDVVVEHALSKSKGKAPNVIVLAHESYHEGVIGLAASRLVEEFYRPAIVLSKKGDTAKASARSISGFNIIEAIRKLEDLYIEGGGHPMAAGFSIKTSMIEKFTKRINELSKDLLTDEVLQRRLKIDLEIGFGNLTQDLYKKLFEFNPTGLGNSTPTFVSRGVELLDIKLVGKNFTHLKLKLRQNSSVFDAIYFGGGEIYSVFKKTTPVGADELNTEPRFALEPKSRFEKSGKPYSKSAFKADIVYSLEENTWNNHKSLQLKVKDLHLLD